MVNMEKSEDQDRKIVLEFCHLLEKSKQLFNGLRYVRLYMCINLCTFGQLILKNMCECVRVFNETVLFVIPSQAEICHSMVTGSGRRISAERSMSTQNYGNSSNSIDWCWTRNTA